MKNIGIYDLTDCSNLDYKTRIDIYKSCGFDELGLYLDNNYMQGNENYMDIIGFAQSVGMKIKQVHIDYKIANLICDDSTNEYFEYLETKAVECESLQIPYVVLHASKGDNPPEISQNRLKKLENFSKKHPNLTFCFENVRNNTNLEKILGLDLNNIKMCYDLGHAHAYGNEKELCEKYKNKIVCSHLHNNYGKDDHNILSDGEIDYAPILEQLIKIPNVSNCFECFPGKNLILSEEKFENFVKKILII